MITFRFDNDKPITLTITDNNKVILYINRKRVSMYEFMQNIDNNYYDWLKDFYIFPTLEYHNLSDCLEQYL